MKLRLRIEADWLGRYFEVEVQDKLASSLLHLLASALSGTLQEFLGARIALDMAQGLNYKQIAARLGISKKTLWDHRRRLEFLPEEMQGRVF